VPCTGAADVVGFGKVVVGGGTVEVGRGSVVVDRAVVAGSLCAGSVTAVESVDALLSIRFGLLQLTRSSPTLAKVNDVTK
jgi:hypothetical protein